MAGGGERQSSLARGGDRSKKARQNGNDEGRIELMEELQNIEFLTIKVTACASPTFYKDLRTGLIRAIDIFQSSDPTLTVMTANPDEVLPNTKKTGDHPRAFCGYELILLCHY